MPLSAATPELIGKLGMPLSAATPELIGKLGMPLSAASVSKLLCELTQH